MRSEGTSERCGERTEGFALLGVLAILIVAGGVLASLTATGIETHWGSEADLRRVQSERRLLGIARAAAAHALAPSSLPTGPAVADGSAAPVALASLSAAHDRDAGTAAASCEDGSGTISVRTIDHSGLIDLNAASPKLMRIGFVALGFEDTDADALARATLAHRMRGTRWDDGGITIMHGPKGAPLESVHELTDLVPVRSVDGRILHRTFTVRSGSGALRIDRAPEHVVRAVRLTAAQDEPFVVEGGPDRRPALTVEVERRAASGAAAPSFVGRAFGVALEVRPDSRRAVGYRTLSVTSGPIATDEERGHATSAAASSGACAPWLSEALAAMASPADQTPTTGASIVEAIR